MAQTAGLVLAAGAGRRFGGPKAPHVVDGERLVDRAVRVLSEGGCAPVVVVLGAWVGDVPGAVVVVNSSWSEGMGSSLAVGLGAISLDQQIDRVVVTLVDLPGLTGAAVRRLVGCDSDLAAAAYQGVRGHPVVFGRAHWSGASESATGDQGARRYLSLHRPLLVEVGDIAEGEDLDN